MASTTLKGRKGSQRFPRDRRTLREGGRSDIEEGEAVGDICRRGCEGAEKGRHGYITGRQQRFCIVSVRLGRGLRI